MNFWVIQALGLLGSLIVLASVQFNNRKVILLAQATACALWLVHYGALGAMTAAATNIISFARSAVFYNNDKPWAKSRVWLWLFLILFALNSVLTWDGWKSLLPGGAMCLTTLALWTKDMRRTRILYLLDSPLWLTYDLLTRSYSCALIETVALCSYIAAVWRFDVRGAKKPRPTGEALEKNRG